MVQKQVDEIKERWATVRRLDEPRNPDGTQFTLQEAADDVFAVLALLHQETMTASVANNDLLRLQNNIAQMRMELQNTISKYL